MSARLDNPLTEADPLLRGVVRATVGGRVDHVTVRVTTFQEVPDIGPRWTFVATYGGRQVHRVALTRAELAARGWTVAIPATATTELEGAGFR